MPRKTKSTVRTFEQIFEQAGKVGADNVLVNDDESGIIWAGGAEPLDGATIANKRYRGELNIEVIRGANREALHRLSDLLKARDQRNRAHRSAA